MKPSLLLTALDQYSRRIALEGPDTQLTYATLKQEVQALALHLRQEQAVGIVMQNCPAWVVADLACLEANVPCVPLPPFFTHAQVEHARHDAGISLILTDQPERFQGTLEPVTIAGQKLFAVTTWQSPVRLPHGIAKITYTSGTTGTPKGVCLTQEAMETVAQSILCVLEPGLSARHVCLLPLPVLLENVAGLYAALLSGATCCLPSVTHDPEPLTATIAVSRATSCIMVPELLRALLASNAALPTLRFAAVGGAHVDLALLEKAQARGLPVYEGYGLSECCSVLTLNAPGTHRPGSVGKKLPHVTLRVGNDGEIEVRDPLFSGYLGDAPWAGVWYPTGDIGRMDEDGFLHIEGRKKNIYITSHGRNVSPEWPESLLQAHPAIAQATVFGEGKPCSAAVIVVRNPQQAEEAVRTANTQLPEYARIGAWVIADEPFSFRNGQLTGNGRVRREAVYEAYRNKIETCYQRKQEAA